MIGVKKVVYMEGAVSPSCTTPMGRNPRPSTGGMGNNGSELANEKEIESSMKMIGVKRVVYMKRLSPSVNTPMW